MISSLYRIIVRILSLPDRVWTKFFNSVIHWCFKDINGYLYHPHQLKGLQYISIGYNTGFGRGVILTAWDEFAGFHYKPSIHIGNHCHIVEHSHITACHSITIGDNLLTGRYVYISDNRSVSNGNSRENTYTFTNPDIITNHYRTLHMKRSQCGRNI